MKRLILFTLLFSVLTALYSQQSYFEYVEGEVVIKRGSGEMVDAQIGDFIAAGDSVITGLDGFAELSLENSSTITIDNDTVFLFSQKEKQEEKKSIFMVVLGKIKFKFDKLLNEPDIQTPATVAGIRGTEFTVVSALDGSSLYVVDEGSVAVEAEGGLVVLQTEEGVEIPVGEEPGEKFEVKVGQADYSGWIERGKMEFLKHPAETLSGIIEKLEYYSNEADFFNSRFEISNEELNSLREKLPQIGVEKGNEAKSLFYKENIFPMEIKTSNLVLNFRYYALSALSLRRFVLTPMYVQMKTQYIIDENNSIYIGFLKEYERFLMIFNEKVVPYLVEADI